MATHQLKWQPDEAAELRVLGDTEGEPVPVRIADISGKRLHLQSPAKIPGGAPVRVDWDGQLVLGQVLDIEPGGFWIEIHHMLLDAGTDWQKHGWRG